MVRRLLVVGMLLSFACSGTPVATDPSATSSIPVETGSPSVAAPAFPSPSATTVPPPAMPPTTTPTNEATGACPPGGGDSWTESVSAEAEPLMSEGGLTVEAVVYPHPDYPGNPWSQWGQGLVVEDGRFYSAIGDHLGVDGNSFVYEYSPETNQLTLIADLAVVTGHADGAWGYGKVHAQMAPAACGIYLATYWGTKRDLVYDDSYQGDRLLMLDPTARTTTDISVLAPGHGIPSLASSPEHGLLYAEAVDPFVRPIDGPFVVVDEAGSEVFRTEQSHVGFRSIAVDRNGRAMFSTGNGELAVYDPDTNQLVEPIRGLPGEWLRAATTPAPDGTIYGVTREPDELFALGADGTIRRLGPVQGYTTSLALSPDGSTVYYVPGAHGGSFRTGTPLVAVDTATGEEAVLVSLNRASEEALGLTLGGTFNVAITPDGQTLYIGMNAGEAGSDSTFGSVVLLIVHLDQ